MRQSKRAGFWEHGFEVCDDLIDPQQVAFTGAAMQYAWRNGHMPDPSNLTPQGSNNQYGSVEATLLHGHCQPVLERITARELIPTYCYSRVYPHGSELIKHLDRESCEVSASLMILAEPAEPHWPIFIKDLAGAEHSIALRPGSAVIYQGHKVVHWRDPFPGERHFQVFLHYVLKDGPFAKHEGDMLVREGLHPG